MVVEDQRRRLFAATARALAERDYTELTVKHVIEAAAVPRSAFDANFDNRRDCVLAAHRDVFGRLQRAILDACASERDWPQRVRAALASAFAFARRAPEEARLLTLDAVAADPVLAGAVGASKARLAALLREGRHQSVNGPTLPERVEEGVVAAALTVSGRRLREGDAEGLRSLEPEVLQFVLTPYLGIGEAAQVARSSR